MDKHCTASANLFFGGKELIFSNYDYTVKPWELVLAGDTHFLATAPSVRSKQLRAQKISDYGNPITLLIEMPEYEEIHQVRNFDLDWAIEHVQIYREFSGGEWLHHQQLFGLATNLLYVKGGLKWMKEMMLTVGKHTPNNFAIIPYVKKMKYRPMRLENFSPYPEDHVYTNLLQAGRLRKGEVVRINTLETKDLETMEAELWKKVKDVVAMEDTDIHIFKVPTGVGKTEVCLDFEGIMYAVPTHALKNEIHDRYRTDSIITPNPPQFASMQLTERINYLYKTGADRLANSMIREVAEGKDIGFHYSKKDSERADRYLWDMQNALNDSKTVITTHHRGMYHEKHLLHLFDEDPMQSILMNIEAIDLGDLNKVKQFTTNHQDKAILQYLLESITNANTNVTYPLPDYTFNDYGEIENIVAFRTKIDTPVLNFFNSKAFILDEHDPNKVYFIKKNDFRQDKKIVILSATANEWLYKQLYGDRVKFYDFGYVAQKGTLVQDMTYSFSRQNLGKDEVLKYAVEQAADNLVITFAQYRSKFKKAVENVYFGNCRGTDKLKGKKLVVVGTPHVNIGSYVLIAHELGLGLRPEDYRLAYQRVVNNGIDFRFMTFENPALRNIQFYFIESELRQAIGRARLSRSEEADVLLLSSYPLPEAKFLHEIENES